MNRLELRKEGDARVSIHSMNDFEDALLGPRGELDAWLECKNEEEVRLHIGKLMHLSVVEIEYKLDALRAKVEAAEQERDALRAKVAERDELMAELQRIADGQEMSGVFTFADVVLRYQEIARTAIARATGEQT